MFHGIEDSSFPSLMRSLDPRSRHLACRCWIEKGPLHWCHRWVFRVLVLRPSRSDLVIERRRVWYLAFERVLRQGDPMCLIRGLYASVNVHFMTKKKNSSSGDLLTKDVLGFEISLIAHLLTVMNIVTYKSQHEFKIWIRWIQTHIVIRISIFLRKGNLTQSAQFAKFPFFIFGIVTRVNQPSRQLYSQRISLLTRHKPSLLRSEASPRPPQQSAFRPIDSIDATSPIFSRIHLI